MIRGPNVVHPPKEGPWEAGQIIFNPLRVVRSFPSSRCRTRLDKTDTHFSVLLSLDAVFFSLLFRTVESKVIIDHLDMMKGFIGLVALMGMVAGVAAGEVGVVGNMGLFRRDAIDAECGKGHFGGVFKGTPHPLPPVLYIPWPVVVFKHDVVDLWESYGDLS
jgi:hypothetical protein